MRHPRIQRINPAIAEKSKNDPSLGETGAALLISALLSGVDA
jgi:hypothetical protein